MTVSEWLKQAQATLEAAGITTARLDCLVLLEDVTEVNRARLVAEPETTLEPKVHSILDRMITLRAKHVPLAYIRGKTEFYGREFDIDEHVLEPRPESETMIELLKTVWATHKGLTTIADVGTGSGALGITAALELPEAQVVLVDIDDHCLAVASDNCDKYELDLSCVKDDLLAHAAKRGAQLDVVLANLPYVPDDYQINTAALHEPRLAIFGGPDGLDLYRRLFKQLADLPGRPQLVLTEALPFQHEALANIAAEHGYTLSKTDDFIQLFELTN